MSDSSSEASRWKLLTFLLAGVLIPIVAALLPWTLDKWTPKDSLEYSIKGPLSADEATAVSMELRNTGKERQSNVEIWLPLEAHSEFSTQIAEDGIPSSAEKKAVVLLDSSPAPSKTGMRDGKTVLSYSNLRPGESISLTAFVIGGTYLSTYQLGSLRIVSDDAVATKIENDDDLDFIFKAGTGLLVILLIFLVCVGFYYDKLIPVEKKRADLQKQLDKLSN